MRRVLSIPRLYYNTAEEKGRDIGQEGFNQEGVSQETGPNTPY